MGGLWYYMNEDLQRNTISGGTHGNPQSRPACGRKMKTIFAYALHRVSNREDAEDLAGDIVVAVLENAQILLVFPEKLKVRLRLVAKALGFDLRKIRRYHQRLVGLEPPLANAYLVGTVRDFGNEMVIHQRIAERLETVRGLHEKAGAFRGIPPVKIWIGAHFCDYLPQHFLYFFPEPHGHGSLRPIFGSSRTCGRSPTSSPSTNFQPSFSRTNFATSW